VELHCTAEDLWISIEGGVFDVTRYQGKHPGGGDKLLRHAGRDATDKFVKVRSHPEGVRDIAAAYRIGSLAASHGPGPSDEGVRVVDGGVGAAGGGFAGLIDGNEQI